MEQLCQRLPRFIDQPCRMESRLVCSAARVARCLQSFQHSLPYLRRFMKSRRGIVQINHGLTTFPAPSIFSAITYMLVTPPTASFSVRP